ncbi:glycosyltransferase family 1 protein [Rhodoferax sp. TBRC 17198]|uniref:glycosyltransferase family 4 protein n=1 Tax=Rhodoferax potami TaxID=3068338 RepID=UPI0028BD2EF1|nr:glycosyltransferase family 1 protein [Rhodoferax sp. TBRC 17198]MDT7521975.1 glycosyltransferase family 1 protein [Rhodoferax sp. TBRC 17198]
MRIGVDARLLSLPLTGIGRYTVEMLHALQLKDAEWRLYSPMPPLCINTWNEKTCLRYGVADSRIARMIWSQTSLPKWASDDELDVFWGATHRLPFALPKHVARVVTIHDLVWRHAPQTMRFISRIMDARLMPQAIQMADVVVAVSQSTANDIEAEFPFARGKVRVVLLGAKKLARSQAWESLAKWSIKLPYLLAVGTLEPRKNLVRLLHAFAAIPEALRITHQLVLVGGKGWGGVSLPDVVEELGLSQHVVICGYVSDEELTTLYTHALCLAMPSLYEGFGLPLVEAMSCGTPVIASTTSSMPEVVGPAGFLVDPNDVDSIRTGICQVLDPKFDKTSWAEIAKHQASKFTWDRAADQTMQVFAEAIEERKGKLRNARSAIF